MKLTMSMFAKQEHYFEARVKQLESERDKLKAALESIASSACCGDCQEAKRVAVKALKESA